MCSRAAARWRLPSSATVRNERICSSMPKTDADRRSPQSVLGIILLRVGVLRWMPSGKESPTTTYKEIHYDDRLGGNRQRLRRDDADAHRLFRDADSRCCGYLLDSRSFGQGTGDCSTDRHD